MSDNNNISFESAALRLEEIVALLEKGGISLDESLKLYEEGISLVKLCNEALDKAENKIKILSIDNPEEITEKDFFENA